MAKQTRDYIFLTLYNKTLRVAIGLQKDIPSIIYTYDLEEGPFGENCHSYTYYRDALTENEAQHIAELVLTNKITTVQSYLTKHTDTFDRYGPFTPEQLSGIVPYEWSAECNIVIDYLSRPDIKGVISIEYEKTAEKTNKN